MALKNPRTTRAVWVLLALIVAAATVDAVRLWRQHRWNDAIAAGTLLPAGGAQLPVQARFALAYRQAASGSEETALQGYRALHNDPAVGQAARYNTANLLMREAGLVRAGAEPGKSIALIELAKEFYRDVLRIDPDHWNARYNLERAQRLLPDPEETDAEPMAARPEAERAATTMRGYSPGMP